MSEFTLVGDFLGELGGNEGDAVGIAENDVTRKNGHFADANREIPAEKSGVLDRAGIELPSEDLESFYFRETGRIAHRAVHHQAGSGFGHHGGAEVVADNGAPADLAIE